MQTESVITLDLHGKTVYQARVAIDAALRRAGGAYRLRLIHGCNQGSAIKNMISEDYRDHPQVHSVSQGNNPGCTELVLRKL